MAENRLSSPRRVVVIGGSTGSIEVLLQVLPALPAPLPCTLIIVVHRRNTADSTLASLFTMRSAVPVNEVDDKDPVEAGHIYLAPADYHLLVETDHTFSLDDSEKVNYSRPSIDVTFESAAAVYGPALTGILLSGANADGTRGLAMIRQRGGLTLAQQPESAQVGFMPQQAIRQQVVDRVVSIDEIIAELIRPV
ncbi:chemotaxis protein CheB [Spirosoma luteolum]